MNVISSRLSWVGSAAICAVLMAPWSCASADQPPAGMAGLLDSSKRSQGARYASLRANMPSHLTVRRAYWEEDGERSASLSPNDQLSLCGAASTGGVEAVVAQADDTGVDLTTAFREARCYRLVASAPAGSPNIYEGPYNLFTEIIYSGGGRGMEALRYLTRKAPDGLLGVAVLAGEHEIDVLEAMELTRKESSPGTHEGMTTAQRLCREIMGRRLAKEGRKGQRLEAAAPAFAPELIDVYNDRCIDDRLDSVFRVSPGPVYAALKSGDEAAAVALLAEGEPADPAGMAIPPLHLAVRAGMDRAVGALIDAGEDVDAYDEDRFTPLGAAVYEGHPQIVLTLLRAGADPFRNYRGGLFLDYVKPFHRAVYTGSLDLVEAFLAAGVDPDYPSDPILNQTAQALLVGDTRLAKVLLRAGARFDPPAGGDSYPPDSIVTRMVRFGLTEEALDYALRNGADVNHVSQNGTALHIIRDPYQAIIPDTPRHRQAVEAILVSRGASDVRGVWR